MAGQAGDTVGDWRVCTPPVGFFWGGTWVLANKDTDQAEGVAELIEWITLDSSEDGSSTTEYETAFIDKKNKTFNKLAVTTDKSGNSIVIKDKAGNTRRVVTEKAGLFNLMAREYTYSTTDKSKATIIHNSSSAVVHLIDGPLCVEN